MAGAPGTADYKGLAVPLFGESEITGTTDVSSVGLDMLTLTASSGNTADFLVFRKYQGKPGDGSSQNRNDALSTAVDSEMFHVGASGVWWRFGTTALTTQSNDAVLTLSTATSGRFHTIGNNSSGLTINLPAVGDGLFYFITQNAIQASNAVLVASPAGNDMSVFGDSAATNIGTGKSTAEHGTGASWMAFSDGSHWYTTYFAALTSLTPASAAGQLPNIT